MLNAIIVTLPKPGKEPNTPPNFRPISLLNIDLKVYAKIIASRLLNLLPLLIHPDQTGFAKGRQTSDATRRLTNIIHLARVYKRPSLLLALDAEKAFDRIHWQYLTQVLSRFGFSGTILSAILALYSKPSAQVLTSGKLSKPFNITNGTRQGCPLSPLIFNLLMEPLAIYIRTHPDITGFPISNSIHKISLFADDIIMILTNVETSLASVHEALDMFNKISYYKVNENKSYIMGIGIDASLRVKLSERFPYTWENEGIKYLGITLTASTNNLVAANYTTYLGSLNKKLLDIGKTELSWTGRLAAFKMIILPQLLYLFRTLPIPVRNSFFSKAQSLINRFLWQGKKASCAFKKITKARDAGGIGHVILKDYHTAAILSQAKFWLSRGQPHRWVELEEAQILGKNLADILLTCITRPYPYSHMSPTMVATLTAWRSFLVSDFSSQITKSIPITTSSLPINIPNLYISHWISKGILTLADLMEGSTIKSFTTLQSEYGLADNDHYRYLQIAHFFHKSPTTSIKVPWRVYLYLTNPNTNIKGISLFYNILNNKQVFKKSNNILAWEHDFRYVVH